MDNAESMTYQDLIKNFNNANVAAGKIGYSRQALSRWKRIGYIPFESQSRIERKTARMKLRRRLRAVLTPRRSA